MALCMTGELSRVRVAHKVGALVTSGTFGHLDSEEAFLAQSVHCKMNGGLDAVLPLVGAIGSFSGQRW